MDAETGKIETIITEEAPSPLNPLGVKGAGEGAILATGAALSNAVANALTPFGVAVNTIAPEPRQHPPLDRRRATGNARHGVT